jgi:hypothetical protein
VRGGVGTVVLLGGMEWSFLCSRCHGAAGGIVFSLVYLQPFLFFGGDFISFFFPIVDYAPTTTIYRREVASLHTICCIVPA